MNLISSAKIRKKNFRLCIVGMGRIGLPLAIAFASKGIKVVGVEKRAETLKALQDEKKIPFMERDLQTVFEDSLKSSTISFAQDSQISLRNFPIIIIAVGTPLKENLSPDMSSINEVVFSVCKQANEGTIVILRSTLIPGTTHKLILPLIKKAHKSLHVAICPERIVEGKALEELESLTEIIGVEDVQVGKIVKELFLLLGENKEITITDTKTAEAAKIFTNVYRYVNFALANEFALISEKLAIDSRKAISLANKKYPRCSIPMPGPSAGPCLRKDGLFLSNLSALNLIKVAWLLNESIPTHIIESIENNYDIIYGKTVGVLGNAYKANIDDTRDSLAIKMIEELKMKGAYVKTYDPYTGLNSDPITEVLKSEIIILAVNHSYFERINSKMFIKTKLVYDVWGQLTKLDLGSKGIIYMILGNGITEKRFTKWKNHKELVAVKY